jgi:hypothetical protein
MTNLVFELLEAGKSVRSMACVVKLDSISLGYRSLLNGPAQMHIAKRTNHTLHQIIMILGQTSTVCRADSHRELAIVCVRGTRDIVGVREIRNILS